MSFAVGFGMFAFAPFRPTAYFGMLIAITAFTGDGVRCGGVSGSAAEDEAGEVSVIV